MKQKKTTNILWYALLSTAFIAISLFAARNAMWIQSEHLEEEKRKAEDNLVSLVNVWERNIFTQIETWLDETNNEKNVEKLQKRIRGPIEWVDAIYIWREDDSVNFPPPAINSQPTNIDDHPCLNIDSIYDFSVCTSAPVYYQNYVALRLAQESVGTTPNEAKQLVEQVSPPLDASFLRSVELKLPC